MNFNEFKAEYLHFNPTVNPNAQGAADDEKTRRLNWINQAGKTIGINKRNILFNQIYNLPTNFNVNKVIGRLKCKILILVNNAHLKKNIFQKMNSMHL